MHVVHDPPPDPQLATVLPATHWLPLATQPPHTQLPLLQVRPVAVQSTHDSPALPQRLFELWPFWHMEPVQQLLPEQQAPPQHVPLPLLHEPGVPLLTLVSPHVPLLQVGFWHSVPVGQVIQEPPLAPHCVTAVPETQLLPFQQLLP